MHDRSSVHWGRNFGPSIALQARDRHLTFGELNEVVDELATIVASRVAPGHAVMIAVERTIDCLCVIYACLKAKRAFIPVDPDGLANKVDQAKPGLLVHNATIFVALNGSAGSEPLFDPFCYPPSTAYVIFTSGSSGVPKAVVVSDRALYDVARDQARIIGCTIGSRILQFARLWFDGSISEILWPLVSGATLVIEPQEAVMPGRVLAETLVERRITHLKTTPAALALTAPDSRMVLQAVVNGGGQCRPESVRKWSPHADVHNAYGLTETTVCNFMTAPLSPEAADAVPIGEPIGGTEYSIDFDPGGSRGELTITGPTVGLGYLLDGRIEQFGSHAGEPAFATGDLVESRGNSVYVVGRNDRQVKVRGYRLDLNEVENAICSLRGVTECVAFVETSAATFTEKLECLVVGSVTVPAVRGHLSAVLDRYKHPTTIHVVDRISYTRLGKVDFRTVPRGDTTSGESDSLLRDTVLAAVRWVLRDDEVGPSDSLIERGADSATVVELIDKLRTDGVECSVESVLRAKSIAELADKCHPSNPMFEEIA